MVSGHNWSVERQRLIDEKHRVQGEIRTLRPRVERARQEASSRQERRRVDRLQGKLDALLNREAELRMAIDRAPR